MILVKLGLLIALIFIDKINAYENESPNKKHDSQQDDQTRKIRRQADTLDHRSKIIY